MRVLVIAAHPDDETLGLGGTIARHTASGHEVWVCILTEGATVRGKSVERQKQHARKACEILGVERTVFCDMRDQHLDALPLIDVIQQIEAYLEDFGPHVVYTHFREDVNQDHRVAFEATMVATRPLEHSPVDKVLCYEVPSSTEWAPPFAATSFRPSVFVDIADTLEIKLEAMEAYAGEEGEYPHPRSYEAIRARAQTRGSAVGLKAAEAFMLVREVIRWR
jgi:LmbE family N-acetylglucosaminyl deacetylase